jgi:hypothetical protein
MKPLLFLSCLAITALRVGAAEPPGPPKDSLAITTHSAIRARMSPGASIPDRIAMNIEVEYILASAPEGIISLALDEGNDMEFSTFDSSGVNRGRGAVNLKAAARMIQRPVLHCLVILKKKGAAPSDPPLATTGMTIDIKGLSRR